MYLGVDIQFTLHQGNIRSFHAANDSLIEDAVRESSAIMRLGLTGADLLNDSVGRLESRAALQESHVENILDEEENNTNEEEPNTQTSVKFPRLKIRDRSHEKCFSRHC